MNLKSLLLDNYRNYEKNIEFNFDEKINLIIGRNGVGKTNILEAIQLLSIGKSARAILESDLINVDSNYARVIGIFDPSSETDSANTDKLEISFERKLNSSRIQKTFKINNAKKTSTGFIGHMKSILFSPEDIRLVAGSPARRREYLDRLLVQVFSDYRINLLKYNRVLKHRNKLLEMMKGQIIRAINQAQLDVWNKQLIESGSIIQNRRTEFFNYLKENTPKVSKKLFNSDVVLFFEYKKKQLSEKSISEIQHYEIASGITQVGPQRDDFDFIMRKNNRDLKLKEYGSRGQQRTGVLCIKFLEIEFIQDETKVRPILLLDDIFSELDPTYRESVLNIIKDQQTFITSADKKMIPKKLFDKGKEFYLD